MLGKIHKKFAKIMIGGGFIAWQSALNSPSSFSASALSSLHRSSIVFISLSFLTVPAKLSTRLTV